LEPIKYFNECVCHCIYRSRPVVAKIARFEFEIPYIERESLVYRIIDDRNIGPGFLGYLTENDRVMGFLLEYIPTHRKVTSSDSEVCLHVLRKLHRLKILLDDNNKSNFLVGEDGKIAFICDFSNSKIDVDEERLLREENEITKVFEDDDWSDFGQERLKSMSTSDYRI
jgi:serine/threonine protein kinase